MDKQIYLGTHLLHGTNHFGQWITEATEGWDEPPAVRDSDEDRPASHGSFDLPSYFGARTPTLDGILFSDSRAQALQGLQSLNANARLGMETLTVTDAGRSQWARVKLAGLDHSWVTSRAFRWQLRLKAPDPRKYGEVNRFSVPSGTTEKLFHRGNYDAWPSFTVTGNMPGGYTLRVGGRLFTVLQPLTSGSHVVDFRNGRLRVNGSLVSGGVGAANLTPVPPGTGANFQLQPVSGSGTAAVTVYDTFI